MKNIIIILLVIVFMVLVLACHKQEPTKTVQTDTTEITNECPLVDTTATPHFNAKTAKRMWLVTNIHAPATLNGDLRTEFKRGEEVECNIVDTTAYINSFNEDADAACEYQIPITYLSDKPPTK